MRLSSTKIKELQKFSKDDESEKREFEQPLKPKEHNPTASPLTETRAAGFAAVILDFT